MHNNVTYFSPKKKKEKLQLILHFFYLSPDSPQAFAGQYHPKTTTTTTAAAPPQHDHDHQLPKTRVL